MSSESVDPSSPLTEELVRYAGVLVVAGITVLIAVALGTVLV